MKTLFLAVLIAFAVGLEGPSVLAQTTTVPTSVDAKLLLDAAGPAQRKSLNAIYLILCPGIGAGSGFLLENGIIVTNVHVIAGCTEQTLLGISATNKQIKFSRVISDKDRDLALLVPAEKLSGGLKLAASTAPTPGIAVTTWGYPFLYNGASPLLSVGYVSGYREVPRPDNDPGKPVKHIIVNGAFNHGNSGGPLLLAQNNEVVGIVVLTFNFYPPEVAPLIERLSNEHSGLVWTYTQPDGSSGQISEAQITGQILDQFYQKTQVMIGEAVAVSELVALLKEHRSELPAATVR